MTLAPVPHAADTDRDDACPGCGTTTGVQLTTCSPPLVQSGSCTACHLTWAVTVVNPRPAYSDRLAATVELLGAARSVLRSVITLAGQVDTLTDRELAKRLTALAARADQI